MRWLTQRGIVRSPIEQID